MVDIVYAAQLSVFRFDGELVFWLRSLACDDETVQRIRDEEYTKNDLLDLISRDELRSLGLRLAGFAFNSHPKILYASLFAREFEFKVLSSLACNRTFQICRISFSIMFLEVFEIAEK